MFASPSGHGDEQHVSTATPGEDGGQAEEDAASAMEQGARARPRRHRACVWAGVGRVRAIGLGCNR